MMIFTQKQGGNAANTHLLWDNSVVRTLINEMGELGPMPLSAGEGLNPHLISRQVP